MPAQLPEQQNRAHATHVGVVFPEMKKSPTSTAVQLYTKYESPRRRYDFRFLRMRFLLEGSTRQAVHSSNFSRHQPLLVLAQERHGDMRPRLGCGLAVASLLVLPLLADSTPSSLELHKDNFDAALAEHDEILVHFHAPCARATSRAPLHGGVRVTCRVTVRRAWCAQGASAAAPCSRIWTTSPEVGHGEIAWCTPQATSPIAAATRPILSDTAC